MSKSKTAWRATSLHQEAYCRHQMVADIYLHAERIGHQIQILSHDIDVDGVDLTLVHDSWIIPLQLKSWLHGAKFAPGWKVRRRIPFPENYTPLSKAILTPNGPATDGLGGALVVQVIVRTPTYPFARVAYRVGSLPLIFLRFPVRAQAIVAASQSCPRMLRLSAMDLTPPVTIAEMIWLLLHVGGDEIGQEIHPIDVLLAGNEPLARSALARFERDAKSKWISFLRSVRQ